MTTKITAKKIIRIMEVCGTHTQAISKSGIRFLLPEHVKLLSGPGCPVCVTSESYIDMAIELLTIDGVILATFGDMLKVKGTQFSIADQPSSRKVVTVYSPEDAVKLAHENPDKTVVFLAVGFETTAPLIAAIVKNVHDNGPDNLCFLTALKRMEPVLRLILEDERCQIDGLICPGHVAAVIGAEAFRFVTQDYHLPAVICGFESNDIQNGIDHLLKQIEGKMPLSFSNLYTRCVTKTGNERAQDYLKAVFETADACWRGIGVVPNSALVLSNKYAQLDAKKKFGLSESSALKPSDCLCSEIILGIKTPYECKKFGMSCTPQTPFGPCMISSEGACAAYYKYGRFIVE